MGMPGFGQVLASVADAWQQRRAQVLEQAETLTRHLQASAGPPPSDDDLSLDPLQRAERALGQSFDPTHGGFGPAPKFPHPMDLRLLLNMWSRRRDDDLLHRVTFTLDKMAAGGMYDQVGGGFHRYSVDDRWLVDRKSVV